MRACFAHATIVLATLALSFGAGARENAAAPVKQDPATATAEQEKNGSLSQDQELATIVRDSGRSAVDLVRELERFLLRYPDSKHKDEIARVIFSAARELHDDRRIAIYGERLLQKDGNEIGVLGPTARALALFEDREAAARALDYGKRLEKEVRESMKASDDDANARDKAKRQFDLDRVLGDSLLIQANASGVLGKSDEAIDFAAQAFDISLNAESARARARWLEKAGRFDEAVIALTDAFALGDTSEAHAHDREKMSELYRRTHKNYVGLGDLVLAGYDRVTGIALERNRRLGNATRTKAVDFRLSSPAGPDLSLDTLRGKVVVMDFWATWCQPCRAQRPLYDQVRERFKSDERVVFLAIDSDQERDMVPRFLKEQKFETPVYYEDGLAAVFSVTSIPTTVLLDRQGELFSKLVGFSPVNFVDLLTDRIHEALNAKGGIATPMASHAN